MISTYAALTDKCINLNTAGLNKVKRPSLNMGLELKTNTLTLLFVYCGKIAQFFALYKGRTMSNFSSWKGSCFFLYINSIAHQDKLLLQSVGVKELTKHFTITTALAHIDPSPLQLGL